MIFRDADERVKEGQRDTGRKIGERVIDIEFWERELAAELERMIIENQKMQECRRVLQRAIQDLEGPLHIAQECLYHRESRKGFAVMRERVSLIITPGGNISRKLSSIFSFFNFLRNSGRFFRFLQKVLDCLRKLQNEKFNIQRKAEKLQISDKF